MRVCNSSARLRSEKREGDSRWTRQCPASTLSRRPWDVLQKSRPKWQKKQVSATCDWMPTFRCEFAIRPRGFAPRSERETLGGPDSVPHQPCHEDPGTFCKKAGQSGKQNQSLLPVTGCLLFDASLQFVRAASLREARGRL